MVAIFTRALNRLAALRALRHVHWGHALRGGIICVVPAVLAATLNAPMLSWSAIASFWTCLADPGGRPRTRLYFALSFGLAGSLASGIASWSAAWPVVAVVLATAVAFTGAWVRVGGAKIGIAGLLVATAFGVSTVFPGADLDHAIRYTLYFLFGNLWAAVFNLAWPEESWAHARRAVAACFVELSEYAFALSRQAGESILNESGDDDGFGAIRAAVRLRLEAARDIINEVPDVVPATPHTYREIELLSAAEQVFVALVGLEDLLTYDLTPDESLDWRTQIDTALANSARLLGQIAMCCNAGPTDGQVQLANVRREFEDAIHPLNRQYAGNAQLVESDVNTPTLVDVLMRISAAFDKAQRQLQDAGVVVKNRSKALGNENTWHLFSNRLLRELNGKSDSFQYALRVALVTAISVGVVQTFKPDHGYWLILTALFTMQPSFASTVQISRQRLVGTLLGGILAALLGLLVHSQILLAALVLPFCIGALAGRSINYLAYTLFLTTHFILVAHLGQPGESEFALAFARTLNSVLGAGLAIAISFVIWPRWEKHRITLLIGAAIVASSRYICEALYCMTNEGHEGVSLADLRRRACIAVDEIETSVKGMAVEPHADANWEFEAHAIVVTLRRTIRAAALLELANSAGDATSNASGTAEFANWVRDELSRSVLLLQGKQVADVPFSNSTPWIPAKSLSTSTQQTLRRISKGVTTIRVLVATGTMNHDEMTSGKDYVGMQEKPD